MNDPRALSLPFVHLKLVPGFRELGEAYRSLTPTTPLPQPEWIHFNAGLADTLGLEPASASDPIALEILAGNRPYPGSEAFASVYAGHQFGVFVPQLGDGRAITIAQVQAGDGGLWELQLKGAGKTPYSRFADGRAVLRSSIREYLCSEAMHALGIPTTRALSLIGSPAPVVREAIESAAVVCRVAASHVRFGHFEYFYHRGRHDALPALADLIIDQHFPHWADQPDRYAAWLGEVVERTARLMAQWQAYGFCHGVMNTDNFSILGLTIDYGPFGFMDGFDAHHVCNHSDHSGRYAYDQQPKVGYWNCSRLLQATLPLLAEEPEQAVEIANNLLARFPLVYGEAVMERWRAKLGLVEARDADRDLVNGFLNLLDQGHSDFTRSFRMLSQVTASKDDHTVLHDHIHDLAGLDSWLIDYRCRLAVEGLPQAQRAERMNAVNPKFILRNYLVQRAIERSSVGDHGEIDRLFRLLQCPFDEQPLHEAYAAEPPPEAREISVSCSS